ncbi:MAG: tRNA lysidine(34) synthetase TilS [Bacteroidetes bacterium 4484_249]|nr:MAG: tRNA lysidine(34) synthetase TilS [Bacteroidetes bacterium 4484_249]
MLSEFNEYIINKNLFKKDNQILLAVSGGIDSVVMTELFGLAGFNYSIAHCNFGLRVEESDEDEKFVMNLAKKKKVNIFVKKFDTRKFASENKISIQMAARRLRLEWFELLIKQNHFSFYATAHHLNDQIETFFINLLRGTGITGLHGILPKQGNLIHPLLFCYREEIEKFAKENNLKFREDSSNIKTDYTRNKIRHKLIPVLKDINPAYAEIMNKNIFRLQQAEEIYKQQIRKASDKIIITDKDIVKISVSGLLKLKPLETYLFEIISAFGFNYSDINDIINSLKSTSGKVFFSATHRIIKDREYLLIEETGEEENLTQSDFLIQANDSFIEQPIQLKISRYKKPVEFIASGNRNIAFLDADKLEFPLQIRKWEKGDYFYPLGMNNKKLLSDFFIDNKFTIPEKEKTWIIISSGKIVWIAGHRIDDRFKITDKTKEILRIEVIC